MLCSDWGEGGLGFTTNAASKSINATRRLNFQCSLTSEGTLEHQPEVEWVVIGRGKN